MFKNRSFVKLFILFFTLVYFSAVVYGVFFARRRRHIKKRDLNLVPVRNIINDYHQIKGTGVYNFYSNLLGNFVLFIPLPFILIWLFRMKNYCSILVTGLLISIGIECIQYIFEMGVADIDDVILNTLGTAVGLLCYTARKKIFTKPA